MFDPNIRSGYLLEELNPSQLKKALARARKCLRKENIDFDSIAFQGISGAILAPPIAISLHKQLLLVRKSSNIEKSHSCFPVEGYDKVENYIIVDDFIESGKTVCEIIKKIKTFSTKAKCLGILIVCDGNHTEFMSISVLKTCIPKMWKQYFGRKPKK